MFDGTLQSIALDPFGGWPLYIFLLVGVVALAAWAYLTTPAPLSRARRSALWVCRGLALAILVLMLARPVAVIARGYDGKPVLAVLVDRSASMALTDADGVSRSAKAVRAAEQLAARVGDEFDVELRGFDGALGPLATVPQDLVPDSSRATAPGEAIEHLLREERQAPLAGIVMVTDGVSTHGRDLVAQARQLSAPFYGVVVGDSTRRSDLQVVAVDAPPAAFVGEPVGVRVRVRSTHTEAMGAELRLVSEQDGGRLLGEEAVTIAPDGALVEIPLRIVPEQPGRQFFSVSIAGERALPGDLAVNDTLRFALDVRKDRLQVLVLDEHLSWDFAFLRRTLERDTTLSYTHLVRPGGTRVLPLGDARVEAFPNDLVALGAFKAIVLGDVSPDFLDRRHAELIAQFVEAGGGLLLLGGNRAPGLARLSGSPLERVSPIAPVPPPVRGPGSFEAPPLHAEVTVLGDAHPLVMLHGDTYGNRERWRDLPPLRPAAGENSARPGAQVLVELIDGERSFPLVTTGRSGAGRVVAFTGRSLWKWKFLREGIGDDDAFFDPFWVGVMRWLADPEPSSRIWVQPERQVFRHGDDVVLAGRALGPDLQPLVDADVSVTLLTGRDSTRVEPTWGEGGALSFEAGPLPPGRYAYRVDVLQRGAPAVRQPGVFQVGANGPEWWDVAARPDLLRRAASATGGRVVDVADASSLADRIAVPTVQATKTYEARIWNHPLLFVVFVVALGAEWWLRRRGGLA